MSRSALNSLVKSSPLKLESQGLCPHPHTEEPVPGGGEHWDGEGKKPDPLRDEEPAGEQRGPAADKQPAADRDEEDKGDPGGTAEWQPDEERPPQTAGGAV